MEKHIIKQILLEQKEEIARIFEEKIISREIEPITEDYFESELIKAVIGVRRCGKSILAHRKLKNKNYGYINFDDERLIGVTHEDLNDFLEVLKEIDPDFNCLFLDEIQNVEGWELFVNRLRRMKYNIVISGSNSNLLGRELSTHLTGRHFTIELFPFSFREFLLYEDFPIREKHFHITEMRAKIKKSLENYIDMGGFPEIFKVKAKKNYLRQLYDSIVTRDIILRYNIKYSRDLKEIALYAISSFSSKITYNKIRKLFDIKSVHTVKNYLNYLEEAYLVFQLFPFSFKLKERIKSPRKIYCIDIGLINILATRITTDFGKLMENLVFVELKRRNKEIYFYAQTDYEIDFIIKDGLKIEQLVQVCYSLRDEDTRKREMKSIFKGARDLKCDNLLIITWDEEKEEKINSITVKIYPLWKWLLTDLE